MSRNIATATFNQKQTYVNLTLS